MNRREFLKFSIISLLLSSRGGGSGVSGSTSPTPQANYYNPVIFGLGDDPETLLGLTTSTNYPNGASLVNSLGKNLNVLSAWLNGMNQNGTYIGDISYFNYWAQKGYYELWDSMGYGIQIITWENYNGQNPYLGPPTLGNYHISSQYIKDIQTIALYLKNNKNPIYFSLATEFSTYPACRYTNGCTDEAAYSDTYNQTTQEYYTQFIPNIINAIEAIKSILPNAKVGLSFGGWLVTYNDPSNNSGQSFIPYFDSIIQKSDMIFFQSMIDDKTVTAIPNLTNPEQIILNCQFYSKYNKPLGVSHYMPKDQNQSIMISDINAMLQTSWQAEVRSYNLDFFNIMRYEMALSNIELVSDIVSLASLFNQKLSS